jgi:hypothetical protein
MNPPPPPPPPPRDSLGPDHPKHPPPQPIRTFNTSPQQLAQPAPPPPPMNLKMNGQSSTSGQPYPPMHHPQPPTKKGSGDTFSISARSEPSEPEEIFDDETEDSLFILPEDGTADMEYYEQNYSQYYYMIPICGSLTEKYPNYGATSSGEDGVKTNTEKLRDIRKNPQHYFNFGFNMNDYCAYLGKHFMMRMERDFLEEGMRESRGQKMVKQD